DAGAEDADALDRTGVGRGARLLRVLHQVEDVDQVLRYVGGDEPGDGRGLAFERRVQGEVQRRRDRVERDERGGVVPLRLREDALPRLPEYEPPARRRLVQQPVAEPLAARRAERAAVDPLPCEAPGAVLEEGGRDGFVDE